LRAVLLCLEEKGVSWRFESLAAAEDPAAAHAARHAFGGVTVLDHGDFRLYETQAILRYIDCAFRGPGLQPHEARQAARMTQVMSMVDTHLFHRIVVPIGTQLVHKPLLGQAPDPAVVQAALPEAATSLTALDSLLGDQFFMAGGEITLADIMLAPQIDNLIAAPEIPPLLERDAPRLLAWLHRMRARPSMHATSNDRLIALKSAAAAA
jgi:glutathione S-transferase